MMTRIARCAACVATTAVFLSASVSSASAACTTHESNGHCYAIAEWASGNVNGGGLMLDSQCLSVPNPNTDFVDNEIWVDMGNNWTEAGETEGYKYAGGAVTTPTFYWADQRPGSGGYHEHYYGAASMNTYYTVTIKYAGSSEYAVNVGPDVGYSQNQQYPANELQAGTEVTTTAAHDFSYDQYLTWYDTNGNTWGNWGSSTSLYYDSPAVAWWGTQDFSFNHGITGC